MACDNSVLLSSGWTEIVSKFGTVPITVSPENKQTDVIDDVTGSEEAEPRPPNMPSRCTYKSGVSLFCDSPHRHLMRPTDRPKPHIVPNILHCIGDTPLVRINKIGKSAGLQCEILAKCEFFNAGGSVKDRIGVRMIEDAEKSGLLEPGDTIIEPTSGNTGIGLALAAVVKGYRCIIVMPEKMSREKVDVLTALGAEIVRTPTGANYQSEESHISVANRLHKEIPRSHILDQYRNPSNPLAHYEGTAEEILDACNGKIDMFVAGAGTGGTLTGVAMKIKERCPECKVIGIDPLGSVIGEPADSNASDITLYEVEGIGYDFVPTVSNNQYVDKWYKSKDEPTFLMARRLIREEGLLCGGSSGAAMYCALLAAKEFDLNETHRVVVILPDSIRNYMTRFLNDDWMMERHYVAPKTTDGEQTNWWYDYTVGALQLKVPLTVHHKVSLRDAMQLLIKDGFDQVPVTDDQGDVIGMLTLGNMMSVLAKGKIQLDSSVGSIIYKQFRKVTLDTKLDMLSVALNIDHFVLVVHSQRENHGDNSLTTKTVVIGIVTRVNLFEFVMRGEASAVAQQPS